MNPSESIESIYKQVKSLSDALEINYTQLPTLKKVLESRKVKKCLHSEKPFFREYNKTLDKLYETCKKQSEQYNDTGKIHLTFLRTYCDIIIKGFNK